MKPSLVLSIPLAAAVFVAAGLAFTDARPSPSAAIDDHEALEETMYGFKTSLKKLSRTLTPETRAEALKHITEMQRLALDAKGLEPSNLGDTPEADRREHVAEFRKEMLVLLKELADLEIDVIDGRNDDAMKRLRGSLLEIRDRSHDKFQADE